ncbi:phage tail fiber protein [Anaerosolibacter sp.]|uniref:phage tail fiber protein n=1 Tax=Anaerosolibacter sp. TaxID=1872527 RepID=UPI0039EF4A9E
MGAMSNYIEEALLNAVFRNVAYSSPANVYIALYKSDPTDGDVGLEVAGGSYARQAVAFNPPTQAGGKAQIQNSAQINFPVATADWGTITHIGIRNAGTGGNLLYHGALTVPKTVNSGDQIIFGVGDITLTLD